MSVHRHYCFMGAPGVGKGTQAVFICWKMNLQHISTGDILRQAIQQKTFIGLKAEDYMNKGELVSDHLIIDMVREVITPSSKQYRGFVLDGFPRTVPQAEALDRILNSKNIELDQIFLFTLKREELIKRLTGRRIAPGSGKVYHIDFNPPKKEGYCDQTGERLIQRDDDREEAVNIRLKTYLNQQEFLTKYYGNRVKEVSAEGSPDEVSQRLLSFILK